VDFFFPDSQDQIDPGFDFERESSSPDRVRQRDDRYAHEVIFPAPYSGVLLSKALVDGPGSKYTFAQRHRLYRLGVRRFFRLDEGNGPRLASLGDCGAFNYVREETPPYSVEDVFDFYEECGFDYGISVDHVILGYIPDATDVVRPLRQPPQEWIDRQKLTLELAGDFLRRTRELNSEDELGLVVVERWPDKLVSGYGERKRGQVLAREIRRHVRRRERHLSVRGLHPSGIARAPVNSYARGAYVIYSAALPQPRRAPCRSRARP
jgi:hypothetical protein